MIEIWKDIEGYEGLYQISNLGRVKSLNRNKVMTLRVKRNGYKEVSLSKDNTKKHYLVHRLVAQAFIPNTGNKPTVNHIDEDKTNNNVDNLEWATMKEQNNHGTRLQRVGDRISIVQKNRTDLSKRVMCSNGEIYPSINEASRVLQIDNSYIVKVLKGKRTHAHGYSFKYID